MDSLTVEGTLAALRGIEGVMAAFADTAPRAVAAMGGVEGLIARSRMTPIGPIPSLTVDEWSVIASESIENQTDSTRSDPLPERKSRF